MTFRNHPNSQELDKVKKMLILGPDLNIAGGVANYYRTLNFTDQKNISYFIVNTVNKQNSVQVIFRLIGKYISFICKLIFDGYKIILLNPSLDEGKSFHREMIYIIISRLFNKKTVVFFRGWYEPYEEKIKHSKLKTFLFKISYAKVENYIVLGKIFKEKLLQLGVKPTARFFIETTVADSGFLSSLDLKQKHDSYDDKILFLFLSRIEIAKGIIIALDAFKEFTKKNPQRNCSFAIAGDGPDLELVKKHVITNNITGIEFLGHVNTTSKGKILLDFHVLIFPSFTEGLPNSILEAMLYGMPIITRNTGGISEVVLQDVNGFITESFDPLIFTAFFERISFEKELYVAMSEKNHAIAVDNYTSEKVKERMITLFKNL